MNDFLEKTYLNNTIKDWAVALGLIIVCLIAIAVLKRVLLKRLHKWAAKTETTIDDFVVAIVDSAMVPLLYISTFYFSVKTLQLPAKTGENNRCGILAGRYIFCAAHHYRIH